MVFGTSKLIYQDGKIITVNGKEIKLYVKQFEKKVRDRDYTGRNLKTWSTRVYTSGTCDIYPDCEWFPSGRNETSFSCEGWEPKTPEFDEIDVALSEMIGKAKGWN